MKKTKLLATFLCVILVLTAISPMAFALEGLGSLGDLIGISGGIGEKQIDEALDEIGNNGGGGFSFSDFFSGNGLSKIREALGGAADGQSDGSIISAITKLLGGSSLSKDLLSPDILDQLAKSLAGENITTTEAPSTTLPAPTTTEPAPTTTEPVPSTTLPQPTAPYVPPTVYQGPQTYPTATYVPPTSTEPTSAFDPSAYQYVPVMNTTVPILEPTDNYLVEDDEDAGISGKMIIGIVILVLSAGAVVAVAVLLKKSRM